jgi:hypothetical protein
MEPEVRVQRAILRTIQKHQEENDGKAIERSLLGLHTRPYDQDNWGVALDDLVARGVIVESSTIRAKQQQKRAVITYALNPNVKMSLAEPNFDTLEPEALSTYLETYWPLSASFTP